MASISGNCRPHLQLLIGFICGFIVSMYLTLFTDPWAAWSLMQASSPATMISWSVERPEPVLVRPQVRILCFILTHPKNSQRSANIRSTWGRRCDKLLFMSHDAVNDTEDTIRIVSSSEDNYYRLWHKTRQSFLYIYTHYLHEYDWFLKADDDTYVIVENLRYMLSVYPPSVPLYFGYLLERYNVTYMSGGAAYVLSNEALRRLVERALPNESICPPAIRPGPEDFYVGLCLQNVGVYLADSRSLLIDDHKSKFFPIDLLKYMSSNPNASIPVWLWLMSPFNIDTGLTCCSNYSISFHYVSPAAMYVYEFLIYHLEIQGRTIIQDSRLNQSPAMMTIQEIDYLYYNNTKTIQPLDFQNLPEDF